MEFHKHNSQEFWEQAAQLKQINESSNHGRGYSVVTQLVEDLEKGDPFLARINANQQGDKWSSVDPDIKFLLLKNLFYDYRAPWESDKDDFYQRLSSRRIINIDTRFDENRDTFDGVDKKLKEKGFKPYYPPFALTITRFTNKALFVAEQYKEPQEAIDEVLEVAKLKTGKKFVARAIIKTFEQGQKEAFVYFKPYIKRESIKNNFDDGLFVWTESDGKLVAKAEVNDKDGIDLTFEKSQFPDLAERMEELNSGTNMINAQTSSSNPDYVKYHIKPYHNWNLAKRDVLTMIDHWFNPPLSF